MRASLSIHNIRYIHGTWPEFADYFLDAFDWFVGGKVPAVGEIGNTNYLGPIDRANSF